MTKTRSKSRRNKNAQDAVALTDSAALHAMAAGRPTGSWLVVGAAILIVAATVVAFANSFQGTFVLDDYIHIVNNERIRSLTPITDVLYPHRRPVRNLTLAVNYALHGFDVWGYHALNVTVHVLAALTLFGIVRRLRDSSTAKQPPPPTPPAPPPPAPGSVLFALAVALLWAVHPLQTQSVTYIIQRDESMMGLFYLLTLYCVVRGARSSGPVAWYLLATICCALGAGTKAVIVTAPLVVLMFDRAFLADSWRELIRRRWALYPTMCLAMLAVLGLTGVLTGVLDPTPRASAGVGFAYQDVSPLQYLWTQPAVILRYLRLAFVPTGLCLDYDWPVTEGLASALQPGMLITLLLVASVISLMRWPRLGAVAAGFFLILAPTSSFIPIKDVIFEHRMYLPLASVVTLALLTFQWYGLRVAAALDWSNVTVSRVGGATLALTVVVLVVLTIDRNRDYHSEQRMWCDVISTQPGNARAHRNYGLTLNELDRPREAVTILERALELEPEHATAHNGLGIAYSLLQNDMMALQHYQKAIDLLPTFVEPLQNAGLLLGQMKRHQSAIQMLRRALLLDPRNVKSHLTLGNSLLAMDKIDEAAAEYEEIITIDPRNSSAYVNLGQVCRNRGDLERAERLLRRAIQLNRSSFNAHNELGIVMVQRRQWGGAILSFRNAIASEPANSGGYFNLGRALLESGNTNGAINALRRAVALDPQNSGARELLENLQVE